METLAIGLLWWSYKVWKIDIIAVFLFLFNLRSYHDNFFTEHLRETAFESLKEQRDVQNFSLVQPFSFVNFRQTNSGHIEILVSKL